jgi:hypothetical protein
MNRNNRKKLQMQKHQSPINYNLCINNNRLKFKYRL